MTSILKEHLYFFITFFLLLGVIVGAVLHDLRFNTQVITCKKAVVKEKIITTEQIEENLTQEVTYYLIECTEGPYDTEFRIQTGRDYPIGSIIKKTWVRHGK